MKQISVSEVVIFNNTLAEKKLNPSDNIVLIVKLCLNFRKNAILLSSTNFSQRVQSFFISFVRKTKIVRFLVKQERPGQRELP